MCSLSCILIDLLVIPTTLHIYANITNNYDILGVTTASERGTLPYFIQDNEKVVDDILHEKANNDAVWKAINTAKQVSNDFQRKTENIAKNFDVTVSPVSLKSKESILHKMNNDNIDINDVRDIVRNTIIVQNDRDIDKITQEIEKNFTIALDNHGEKRIKDQSTALGYTGTLINVKLKGITGEIQIITQQMIYAKDDTAKSLLPKKVFDEIAKKSGLECGLGHKYYEEWRLSETTEERKRELEKLSRDYYDAIKKIRLK